MSLKIGDQSLPPAYATTEHKGDWVTPEEQLDILHLPFEQEVERVSKVLPPVLANIVVQYAGIDGSLTHWYKAIQELDKPIQKIPRMPNHIHQIMNGKCPVYHDKKNADGTSFRIQDTHFLMLIPEEYGTLDEFNELLQSYATEKYSGKKNPLAFTPLQEHVDVEPLKSLWVLMTKETVPKYWFTEKTKSGEISLEKPKSWVKELRHRSLVQYEIPTEREGCMAIFMRMVAGEKGPEDGTVFQRATQGSSMYLELPCRDPTYRATDGKHLVGLFGTAVLRKL